MSDNDDNSILKALLSGTITIKKIVVTLRADAVPPDEILLFSYLHDVACISINDSINVNLDTKSPNNLDIQPNYVNTSVFNIDGTLKLVFRKFDDLHETVRLCPLRGNWPAASGLSRILDYLYFVVV